MIIYCPTIKEAEELYSYCIGKLQGTKVGLYHASLEQTKRDEVHRKFQFDDIKVLVATEAFGMGIDKPDIRTIVNYGPTKSIESYYQQVISCNSVLLINSRVGPQETDKKAVVYEFSCIFLNKKQLLYYSRADFSALSRRIVSFEEIDRIAELEKKLEQMVKYATSVECRRRLLLQYFGETVDPVNCGTCDNCINIDKSDQKLVDMTKETVLFLQAVKQTGERYGFGIKRENYVVIVKECLITC
jgi:ATP-dependent DNA helicase RecQ